MHLNQTGQRVLSVRFLSSESSPRTFQDRLRNPTARSKPVFTPTTQKLSARNSYGYAEPSNNNPNNSPRDSFIPSSNTRDQGNLFPPPPPGGNVLINHPNRSGNESAFSLSSRLAERLGAVPTPLARQKNRPEDALRGPAILRRLTELRQQQVAARATETTQNAIKDETPDRGPRYQPRGDAGKFAGSSRRSAQASNAEVSNLQQRRDAQRPPHGHASATSNQWQQGRQRSVASGNKVKALPSRRDKTNVSPSDSPVTVDLEQTDLAKLFGTDPNPNPNPKSSTDLRTQSVLECHGGDYSRYISGELSETTNALGPLQHAQLVLARKRDVGMRSRSRILGIVKGSVGST